MDISESNRCKIWRVKDVIHTLYYMVNEDVPDEEVLVILKSTGYILNMDLINS